LLTVALNTINQFITSNLLWYTRQKPLKKTTNTIYV
jgi:hypothetical protein